MAGAAVTITVLTLAAVNTLGISVDLPTALLLRVIAAICACGASGVAGGSFLLFPLACSPFGNSHDFDINIVRLGFYVRLLQYFTKATMNSSHPLFFQSFRTSCLIPTSP